MTTEHFVRYSPAVEREDPQFEQSLQHIVDFTKRYVAESRDTEGIGRAVRDAHAKGYGLARAEVEILAGLPVEYAQGVYATPGRHEAVIRFSAGPAHFGPDTQLGLTKGIGLKIFGVDGPTLLEDEPDSGTMDYATINAPVFFANTVQHYEFVQQIFSAAGAARPPGQTRAEARAAFHRMLSGFLTGLGTLSQPDWAWDELLAFLAVSRYGKPVNLLLSTYWTMGAVRHGDYIGKVSMAPVDAFAELVVRRNVMPTPATPDVFRRALVEELRERPFEFDLRVQLCTDLEAMPVEDVTVEWSEQLSPPVTVAKLRLPRQDIGDDENLEIMDAMSFTPWRCTAAHRPLGEIQRARKEVYRQSSLVRHQVNGQIRAEPRNLSEVFGKSKTAAGTR
jgi:hypothetical protein